MDRIIETSEYGICIFSMDVLQHFLKAEKLRTKKILALFQKDKKKFLKLQQDGVWIPFAPIDSFKYCIKLKNYDEEFSDKWEKKFEYEGFNLAVENGVWISDIGSFLEFKENEYQGDGIEQVGKFGIVSYFSDKERWYKTLDGVKTYSDFWYDVPVGKYLVTIKGYARKQIVDKRGINYGFQFELKKIEEFNGYKNPREEQYDFNVANMK